MPKRTVSEKEITIPEVKKILEAKGEELDQFQRRTFDYAAKFSKIDALKAEKLVNKLVEKFGIIRSDAVQIVNCMPTSVEELRVFFAASKKKIILTSQLEELLETLDEYR